MAEFDIFVDDRDIEDLWHLILVDLRLQAWPDPFFGDPPILMLSTLADVAENLRRYPEIAPALGYFLTSPAWAIEPLQYRQCKNNPNFQPHWYVNQRYGGPSIDFVCRFGYPWHKPSGQLIGGMFADYPYYYSTEVPSKVIPRPDGLVSTMTSIKRWIRARGGYVVSGSGKRALAMPGALAAHQNGVVLRKGDIVFTPKRAARRLPGKAG